MNLEANETFDAWGRVVRLILVGAVTSGFVFRATLRTVTTEVLPRKHRLEALLTELDA